MHVYADFAAYALCGHICPEFYVRKHKFKDLNNHMYNSRIKQRSVLFYGQMYLVRIQ